MDGRYTHFTRFIKPARHGGWPMLCLALAALAVGCNPAESASNGSLQETSNSHLSGSTPPAFAAVSSQPSEPPREYTPGPGPAPTVPQVLLTNHMQSLCIVQVDDTAPDFTLPNYEGGQSSLADLMGQKLTVLVFWKSDELFAAEQFLRLEKEVAADYTELGVEVVTVHVGEKTSACERLVTAAQPRFAVLVDADGSAMGRYASDLLPRTYLLDPQGRILWFDLEYSRSTRRELDNAIRYHLLESQ